MYLICRHTPRYGGSLFTRLILDLREADFPLRMHYSVGVNRRLRVKVRGINQIFLKSYNRLGILLGRGRQFWIYTSPRIAHIGNGHR